MRRQRSCEAHFYRDQSASRPSTIASPWLRVFPRCLSFRWCFDPLAEMLRQSRPCSLELAPNGDKDDLSIQYGSSTIGFLKDIVKKLVHHISSSQVESQSIWTDIFSLGPTNGKLGHALQHHRSTDGGSCTIAPSTEAEDMGSYVRGSNWLSLTGGNSQKGTDPKHQCSRNELDSIGAQITTMCSPRTVTFVLIGAIHITDEAFNIGSTAWRSTNERKCSSPQGGME